MSAVRPSAENRLADCVAGSGAAEGAGRRATARHETPPAPPGWGAPSGTGSAGGRLPLDALFERIDEHLRRVAHLAPDAGANTLAAIYVRRLARVGCGGPARDCGARLAAEPDSTKRRFMAASYIAETEFGMIPAPPKRQSDSSIASGTRERCGRPAGGARRPGAGALAVRHPAVPTVRRCGSPAPARPGRVPQAVGAPRFRAPRSSSRAAHATVPPFRAPRRRCCLCRAPACAGAPGQLAAAAPVSDAARGGRSRSVLLTVAQGTCADGREHVPPQLSAQLVAALIACVARTGVKCDPRAASDQGTMLRVGAHELGLRPKLLRGRHR